MKVSIIIFIIIIIIIGKSFAPKLDQVLGVKRGRGPSKWCIVVL